jgi:hypothetical protein
VPVTVPVLCANAELDNRTSDAAAVSRILSCRIVRRSYLLAKPWILNDF